MSFENRHTIRRGVRKPTKRDLERDAKTGRRWNAHLAAIRERAQENNMSWIEAAKKQEPLAWVVFCEKGEEHDYMVFWYEEDAKEHAELTEESFELEDGSKEVIPLYPDLPDAIELVEEMVELLEYARPSTVNELRKMEWRKRRKAVLAKVRKAT